MLIESIKMFKIFIDGAYGTAGLILLDQLKQLKEKLSIQFNILMLENHNYKNAEDRYYMINKSDLAILCLPDEVAKKTMEEMHDTKTIIIDASSAHRTNKEWTYGFPELSGEQLEKIVNSKRISNPGCFATGMLSILAPLQKHLNPIYPLSLTGVTGYSAGGKKGIVQQENSPLKMRVSNFNIIHKHMEEVKQYSDIENSLSFNPMVGDFERGQLVQLTVFKDYLSNINLSDIPSLYEQHYKDSAYYEIVTDNPKVLLPETMSGKNGVKIYLSQPENANYMNIVAMYDNLGKGASGSIIQTIKLLLEREIIK